MKNLPILAKFLSVLALLGVISVLAVGYLAVQLRVTAGDGERIASTTLRAATGVADATAALQRARGDLLSLDMTVSATDSAAYAAQLSADLISFNKGMDEAATLLPFYKPQLEDLHKRGLLIFNRTCGSQMAQAAPMDDACMSAFIPFGREMTSMHTVVLQAARAQYKTLENAKEKLLVFSLCAILLAIFVVGGICFLVVRNYITSPLKRLGGVMRHLGGGDLTVVVPETDRRDEIGEMAGIVVVLQKAGLEKERLEQEAVRAQADREAERIKSGAERAKAAAEQESVVNALADGLDHLSSGNLIFRITKEFAADYEKLRFDFNKAMDRLQRTLQHIATNASGVDTSAREITQSADDMSRRTEQQAASLEQTAAALDEITATVRKSSEGIREAHDLTNKTRIDAERSGTVVTQTVTAMKAIEESASKVANIIGIIDEIAFQTNLLALNAGVEAARAGEAGRGFAVVATEVRALAQRSADAAKEIKGLIRESGGQVQMGVKLVNETGTSLSLIAEQVARLNLLITNAANSSKEQSTALSEVNNAVNQMDQVTQQNAAMAEESNAASHALAHEANELRRLVGQFNIAASEKTTSRLEKAVA